jgi:CubicO group peptidase (beta-lactamase class C family)
MKPPRLIPLGLALLVSACAGDAAPSQAPVTEAPVAVATPTVGLDSALLTRATERAAGLPRLYSFLVSRHGDVEAELYFHGRGPTTLANIKSASKTIIATLVGIAIEEGALASVDQPIAPYFDSYLDPAADSLHARITLGNLLSMQAGLEPTSSRNYGRWVSSPNWVRHAITRPMVEEPGGRMLYSTGTSHLLSAILTEATGRSTWAFAREKLAGPLGIDLRPWTTDPQGIFFGGNEMRMTPRDLHRFGELFLAEGEIDGSRIVPREWIETSWIPRTTSRFNSHRYGYGWWIKEVDGHPVYFAWGYGGQYLFLVPDLELIVITTSMADEAPRDGGHLRMIHSILDEDLIPAAVKGAAPLHPSISRAPAPPRVEPRQD